MANEGFLHKLAWELMVGEDPRLSFIYQRHTTADGHEVCFAFSVWHGLTRNREEIRENCRWIPGNNSMVSFWTEN